MSLALVVTWGTGCELDEDEWIPETEDTAISDKYEAESAVKAIQDLAVDETLDRVSSYERCPWNETYNAQVVQGTTGTATVTGSSSCSETSSADYVSTTHQTDVEIAFSNYQISSTVRSPDTIKITGNVEYYSYSRSTQSGLNYSSDRSMRWSGSADFKITNSKDPSRITGCYEGNVTFSASGESDMGPISGTLTTSSGATYSF